MLLIIDYIRVYFRIRTQPMVLTMDGVTITKYMNTLNTY